MTIGPQRLGWLALAIAFSASCGASAPSDPKTPTAPTTTASPAAGRWVGTGADGMIVTSNPNHQCPGEFDLELNLTVNGSTVSGTATTKLRVVAVSTCTDVFGQVANYSVVNGTIQGNAISFEFPNASYRFSGSINGSRMTGTFMITEFPESGTFAVTHQ